MIFFGKMEVVKANKRGNTREKRMLEKSGNEREQVELYICTDQLVPEEHLLRKIDAAIDFKKIYEIVEPYYCNDNGRPSIDPVVLVKMVFIQHLFGIPSLRKTVSEIQMNVGYRWFLGFGLTTPIPHFATVSYAFATRFPETVIEQIFKWILNEAVDKGFVDGSMVFVDSTPVKASANRHKKVRVRVEKTARRYEKQLREEVNTDRLAHGKRPLKDKDDSDDNPPETKEVSQSKTDKDSGILRKGEHKVDFSYSVHTACDNNNFILCSEVTAANVHDSQVFEDVYEKVNEGFDPEVVVVDAGYKTPRICKRVFEDGRKLSAPYKRPMGKKGFFYPYEYSYDEYYDCVLCPQNQPLKYSRTDKNGYRHYVSDKEICKVCHSRMQCSHNAQYKKTVLKHIWSDYVEMAEDFRHSPEGKQSYTRRKETIERVFADAKEKHGMRYTNHRGLARVKKWVTLKFAAMNLKKMAMWAWRDAFAPFLRTLFFPFLIQNLTQNANKPQVTLAS